MNKQLARLPKDRRQYHHKGLEYVDAESWKKLPESIQENYDTYDLENEKQRRRFELDLKAIMFEYVKDREEAASTLNVQYKMICDEKIQQLRKILWDNDMQA